MLGPRDDLGRRAARHDASTLPRRGARHLPLVVEINGFGNSKYEYLDPASKAYTDNAFDWAQATATRCSPTRRAGSGARAGRRRRARRTRSPARTGYIHLADVRYEARDAQTLIGELVDEGVARPGASA